MSLNHNFLKGIDWNDTTGGTSLGDTFFVSKAGSDANNGTKETTKLTIDGGANSGGASSSSAIVVGSGIYPERLSLNRDYQGDISAEIVNPDGSGTPFQTNGRGTFQNFKFNLWSTCFDQGATDRQLKVIDCEFAPCINYFRVGGGSGELQLLRNRYNKGRVTVEWSRFNTFGLCQNNIYVDTEVSHEGSTNITAADRIKNELHYRGSLTIDRRIVIYMRYSLFFNCSITVVDGGVPTTYANLQAAKDAGTLLGETWFPDCIEVDPMFKGNPNAYSYVVDNASPAIQAGEAGTNIGAVKRGIVINSSTSGTLVNNQVEFEMGPNGNSLVTANGFSSGFFETDPIDLGRIYRELRFKRNGFSDYLQDVMTSDAQILTNPNPLSYGIEASDVDPDPSGEPILLSRYDWPYWLSNGGQPTYDADFSLGLLEDNPVRYIIFYWSISNNYIQS